MVFELLNVAPAAGTNIGPNDPLRFDIRSDETMGQLAIAIRYPRVPHSEIAYVGMPALSTTFELAFAEFSSVSAVTPAAGIVEQWHFELRRSPRWIGNPTVSVSFEGGGVGPPGPPGPMGMEGPPGPMGPAASAPTGAADDAPGLLSRTIYVHASSPRIGTSHVGAVVQAAPAQWVMPEHIPTGNWFRFIVFGGGGGGGGGAAIVSLDGSQRGGGGGGGGARHPPVILSRADVVAALPITFLAGLGGIGGLGGFRSIGGTSVGFDGTSGTPSEVLGTGLIISAGAGFSGSINTTRRGAGGGVFVSATATAGGLPNDYYNFGSGARLLTMGGGPPSDRPVTGSSGTCYYCIHGGASGGATSAVNAEFNGMNSWFGGCGGGHGGSAFSLSYGQNRGYRSPSAGGCHDILSDTIGGGGGTAGAQPIGPGGSGVDGHSAFVGGEGGGGGGSYCSSWDPIGPGGSGGHGGFPGGGGGGGGTVYSAREGDSAGGDGGHGGYGCIIIDAFI